MNPDTATLPEVCTADAPHVELCTEGGVSHDYRPHEYQQFGRPHVSLRCVWCHVVACGHVTQPDPCLEPYHHRGDHRTPAGVTWPIGGNRP